MKTKTVLCSAFIFIMMTNPVSARTASLLDKEIAQVEPRLMSAMRFEGKPLWTLESRMKQHHVPGVSTAVIKNSRVIWNKIYSFADVESKTPVNSRTLFQAASITPVSVYAAYLKAGQKDKAKQSDQKVLEINPENENAAEILKTL